MPQWAGKWKGGRFYYDSDGRKVFFIEKMSGGVRYNFRLKTRDEDLAIGELARFLSDPQRYVESKNEKPTAYKPVYVTKERVQLYIESIRDRTEDQRKDRRRYLSQIATLGLDLRRADKNTLRLKMNSFAGGHGWRAETLNAFARWLVREEELPSWNTFVNNVPPGKSNRDPTVAYSIEELEEGYGRLTSDAQRHLFLFRAMTGMHQTEIKQLVGAKIYSGTRNLPEQGVGIRVLPESSKSKIAGVVQVMHKSRYRHRQSVDEKTLEAAIGLREGVLFRETARQAFAPIIPSNLRHTFITLAGEVGELVSWKSGGVARNRVAQVVGHRAGSTITSDSYEKIQVPDMIWLPIRWG